MIRKIRNAIETTRIQRRSPEQVGPAVHSMDAIGLLFGRGDEWMLRRMKASALGREYCRFAEENQLFPERLAESVHEARAGSGGFVPEATPEAAYLHDRFRDLHDVWHVLTGYGTDMAGEWGIIAFQTRQVGYRSMAIMAFLNVLRNAFPTRPDLLGVWFGGRRRGARARYLLSADWERLLPMPLEEVRRELGIEPLRAYRPWNYSESAVASARS